MYHDLDVYIFSPIPGIKKYIIIIIIIIIIMHQHTIYMKKISKVEEWPRSTAFLVAIWALHL